MEKCCNPAKVKVPPTVTLRNLPSNTENYLMIDGCLVQEILSLWQKGIVTTGCCCGHGDVGHISVEAKYFADMLCLGYRSNGILSSFVPKSLTLCDV